VVNVTDGADVAVRLCPLKFSLCHFSNLLTLEYRFTFRSDTPAESGRAISRSFSVLQALPSIPLRTFAEAA
jgi:hypothetical protein